MIVYLLGKAQANFDASAREAAAALPRRIAARAAERDAAPPIDWRNALLSTIRYLTFGLVLPLAAIHLWLATVREGLGRGIVKLGRHLARAFAPQSVLTYIAGFLIFGVASLLPAISHYANKIRVVGTFAVSRASGRCLCTYFVWLGNHGARARKIERHRRREGGKA